MSPLIPFLLSSIAILLSLIGLLYSDRSSDKSKLAPRGPQYYIVKSTGGWYPIKVPVDGKGHYFVKDMHGQVPKWDHTEYEDISFDYPDLYAYQTKGAAVQAIEKLEGVNIVEIDGTRRFKGEGKAIGFEREDRRPKSLERYDSVEEYMEKWFGRRKISDVKLGSERLEEKNKDVRRVPKQKYLNKMFNSNS